ncbi:MAG TPA: glycosyltransferase family 39 protein [Allocoleopsis sp.]
MLQKQPYTPITSSTIRWVDVVTLAIGLIAVTFGLGEYGFYEPHEGHFAGVAREMVLRGDWVTPTLNGAPYLNKPPLLYWLTATSTAMVGFTEFAARLPLAIAGWVGAAIAWKWARELWSPAAGQIAALMLCVATGWFIFTHQLLIDVLLSTLLLGISYCLWRLVWNGGWLYFLALYVLLGLAILAKGPFAVVFPVAGCVGLVLERRNWDILQKLRVVQGLMVTLCVILPWTIAVERANPGFLSYFLLNENLKRIADTRWPPDYEVSKVSVLAYLAITAIWCVPWTLVLPQALQTAWQDWRQREGTRGCGVTETRGVTEAKIASALNCVSLPLEKSYSARMSLEAAPRDRYNFFHPSTSRIPTAKSDGVLLLAIATALPILLFLPLSSRLIYYSIPSIAPFVVLCSGWWWRCQDSSQRKGRIAAGVSFCGLGLVACSASVWVSSVVRHLPELSHYPDLSSLMVAIALSIGSGCLIGGIALLLIRPNLALIAIFVGFVSAYAFVTHGFAVVQDFRSSKTLIETANPRLGLTTLWTFEGSRELGAAGAMSYYLDRKGDRLQLRSASVTDGETRRRGDGAMGRRGDGEMGRWGEREKKSISQSHISTLPPGWAKGKGNTIYRIVLVLTDGGHNRLPPDFPGPRPEYAITKRELQEYWNSSRPVVFVTDFMRQSNPQQSSENSPDPPNRNLPQDAGEPLLVVGPRKLYGNSAARSLWLQ